MLYPAELRARRLELIQFTALALPFATGNSDCAQFCAHPDGNTLRRKPCASHLGSMSGSNRFFIPMGGPKAHLKLGTTLCLDWPGNILPVSLGRIQADVAAEVHSFRSSTAHERNNC
jgi:hypothetical protein